MVFIPRWLLGRNTAVAITFLTVDQTGLLSPYSAANSLVGTLDEIDTDSEVQHDNISPMDVRTAHNVIVEDDFMLNLTQITQTVNENMLAYFAANFDYCFMNIARGARSYQGYFVRGNSGENLRKAKCNARLQVKRINIIGFANPVYVPTSDPAIPGVSLAALLGA